MITVTINGKDYELIEDGSLPLIFALRNTLGLKGVRFGCGAEECGACTVLVDSALSYACTTTLEAVAGRKVETIDGLADRNALILRDALLAERAGQCGYCLSGIFVTAYSLLRALTPPDRHYIKKSLSRHLCRCGSHSGILRAVERAVAEVWTNKGDVHE
jgi:nicotinate dehydrogenase subunit A